MEGYLYKWTNYISGWKLRYFVLKNNVLFYFITKGDKPRGKLSLKDSQILEDLNNDLKLQIESSNGTIIYIKAKTTSEREMWLKALNKSKSNNDGKIDFPDVDRSYDDESQACDNAERLHKKLAFLRKYTEKVNTYNNRYNALIEKYKDDLNSTFVTEFQKINTQVNNEVINMRNTLEDMKYMYRKFRDEFMRLADYFEETEDVKMITARDNTIMMQGNNTMIVMSPGRKGRR